MGKSGILKIKDKKEVFNMMKSTRGFTLIELLVVIAIIGILAAVIAPNAFKAIEKSKVAAVESDYKAVKTATLMYYSDVGAWPTVDNDFNNNDNEANAFVYGVAGLDGWDGPYLEKWPTRNPWGGTYTLATYDFGDGESVAFAADKVSSNSATKVASDLGYNTVRQENTAPGYVQNGQGPVYLFFRVGINQ